MRPIRRLGVVLLLVGACAGGPIAWAGNAGEPAPSPQAATPGVELAHTVSEVTGVAISPLLGVGAVGAWKYFHAQTPQQRARLPWFAQPWFWIPALALVGVCFLKDTLGLGAPRLLKKPLDVAEAIEHKISGLIAVGAFVPLIISVFPPPAPESALHGAHGFLAVVDLSWMGNWMLVPAAMVAFFIVFLASNAINVLLLLSPFAIVDAALKGFRLLMLLTVVAAAVANPWVGAVWALVVIGMAWLIAGWSFRLSHFGWVFVWELVTLRRKRFHPNPSANRMFLARKLNRVPARSYGTLLRDAAGNLVLKYRPWLVLRQRELALPQGCYVVGKGLFYSQIMRLESQRALAAMLLPPRYRGHEDELASIYGLAGVRDAGLRAAFRWLKDLLGFEAAPAPTPA